MEPEQTDIRPLVIPISGTVDVPGAGAQILIPVEDDVGDCVVVHALIHPQDRDAQTDVRSDVAGPPVAVSTVPLCLSVNPVATM